jgi:hypothetical protein
MIEQQPATNALQMASGRRLLPACGAANLQSASSPDSLNSL